MHDIREHWTAVSLLLSVISSVYRNLTNRRSNQRPQMAVPKFNNRATSSYRIQMTPNQLFMVTGLPNNLNVSCKLDPYSLQRTRLPHKMRLYVNFSTFLILILWSFLSSFLLLVRTLERTQTRRCFSANFVKTTSLQRCSYSSPPMFSAPGKSDMVFYFFFSGHSSNFRTNSDKEMFLRKLLEDYLSSTM